MRSVFAATIAVLMAWSALTFAGMAVFGMGHMMDGMDMPAGVDCVEHCLGAIPPAMAGSVALVVVMAVFAAIVRMLPAEMRLDAVLAPSRRRWREGIGKAVLHGVLDPVLRRE